MRIILITNSLILLFLLCTNALFAQEERITLNIHNEKIATALLDLAEAHGYEIIFNQSYFTEETITLSLQNQPLKKVLDQLLATTKVTFKVQGQTIRLSKKKQIYGYIIDQKSGEKMISAAFYIPKSGKGLYTNDYGFFSLEVPFEATEAIASYIGYKSKKVFLKKESSHFISIELEPDLVLNEIVVMKEDSEVDTYLSPDGDELLVNEIKTVFATGGEADVFQYLYKKSGVHTGPDGFGGLHVRGGSSDQNMILYDGVKVYNPNHSLGLFSIFNSDLLKHARFSKGNFNPRFGGRVSSVLDLRLKEGSLRKWQGAVGASTLATQINIDGPIVKDKTGIMLAARRTHLDPYFKNFTEKEKATYGETGYQNHYFFDINAKIHHRFNKKDRLFLSYYQGQDSYEDKTDLLIDDIDWYYKYKGRYNMDWGNQLASLRWNHLYGNTLFTNTTISYSDFKYYSKTFSDLVDEDYFYNEFNTQKLVTSFISNIQEVGIDYDVDFFPAEGHHITFGVGYHKVVYEPGASHLELEDSELYLIDDEFYQDTINETVDNAYESHEAHLYINEDWQVNKQSRLLAGIRFSVFETTDFSNNSKAKFNLFSGRLAYYYQLNTKTNLLASYDRTNQPLHLLTNADVGFPNDLWVPSTKLIKPQKGDQFSVALSYAASSQWNIKLSSYYKKVRNQIRYLYGSPIPGLVEDITQFWQEEVTIGTGTSKGIELELAYQSPDLKMNLSYTLSKTDRQFPDFNDGDPYPFQFDQRHNLSASIYKTINKNWWVYANWQLSNGINQTLFTSTVPYAPLETVSHSFEDELSKTNGYQLPLYHRLDLGAMCYFKTGKIGHEILLGIQNAYNQENVYYSYYLEDEDFPEDNGLKNRNSLPLLPTVRYQVRF